MATVYKAWQPSLSRMVAVKVLPSYLSHDEDLVNRFRHEAQAVAKLRHPNIIRIFDFAQEGEWFYIAMELAEGGSLQEMLAKSERLEEKAAIQIGIEVAQGLDHAHKKKFVHRDIKPSNIVFSADYDAIITDFGIVKALEGTKLTRTSNGHVGTSQYMSPEQSQGEEVDGRSDLYSLGVVLYESITGSPPFEADSPLAVLHRHVYEQPAEPRLANPAIADGFSRIILKLLEKDPDRRFNTGAELASALMELQVAPAIPVEVPPVRSADADQRHIGDTTLMRLHTLVKKKLSLPLKAAGSDIFSPPTPPPVGSTAAADRQRRSGFLTRALIVASTLALVGVMSFMIGYTFLYAESVKIETAGDRRKADNDPPPVARKVVKKPLPPAPKPVASGPSLTAITIEPNDFTLTVGQSVMLSATGLFSDSTTKTIPINWSVSQSALAEVDSGGRLTALSEGKVEVEAKAERNRAIEAGAALITLVIPGESPAPMSAEPAARGWQYSVPNAAPVPPKNQAPREEIQLVIE